MLSLGSVGFILLGGFSSALFPHVVHINPVFSAFVPTEQVIVKDGDLRICPPPAKVIDGQCGSGETRRAFFFEDIEYTAVGDVRDLDVGVWLGRRHYVPSVFWFAYTVRDGYVIIYRPW
jgi:hypothetical protein